MPEPDAFERRLQVALRDFAERGVVPVDAVDFAARVAAQRRPGYALSRSAIPGLAWLLLVVALLTVLAASVVFVGARLIDESPEDRAVLIRTFAGPNISAVTVSPNGEMLAATHYADVVLLDVDTGDVRELLSGRPFDLPTVVLHQYRDGKIAKESMYYAAADATAQLMGQASE